jgi:hypothetical protein
VLISWTPWLVLDVILVKSQGIQLSWVDGSWLGDGSRLQGDLPLSVWPCVWKDPDFIFFKGIDAHFMGAL